MSCPFCIHCTHCYRSAGARFTSLNSISSRWREGISTLPVPATPVSSGLSGFNSPFANRCWRFSRSNAHIAAPILFDTENPNPKIGIDSRRDAAKPKPMQTRLLDFRMMLDYGTVTAYLDNPIDVLVTKSRPPCSTSFSLQSRAYARPLLHRDPSWRRSKRYYRSASRATAGRG